MTREVRTNFKIMLAVSVKTQLQTQYRLKIYVLYFFIYQNNPLHTNNCITTTIHIFDCENYNAMQIKCN